MRIKSRFFILVLLCMMVSTIALTSCSNVNQSVTAADTGSKLSISERKANLEKLFEDTFTPEETINGTKLNLQKEFKNPEVALAEFKKTIPTVYPEVLKLMGAKELTSENYEKFGEASIKLSEKLGSKINEDQSNEFTFINLFLDIYENKTQNEATISKAR
ncbi:MAG: hypothetical protein QMB63_08700 [Clostridiaceae bacterium]